MKIAIFCCLFTFCCCFAVAEGVPCEYIGDTTWTTPVGKQTTCYMDKITLIHSPGVTISSIADKGVGALDFYENKKIKFLPINPAEKFPNIMLYRAYDCSIEAITKKNFKALSKLVKLYLGKNKLETVPNDTFEDLTALEVLWLDNNKIVFINSAAFGGLNKLGYVQFEGNICIQGRYQSATSVASMIPTLTGKCGFTEVPSNDSSCHKQTEQINILDSLVNKTKAEMEKSRNENTKSLKILETELTTAKAQIERLKMEGRRHQDENAKLKNQVQDLESKLAEPEKWHSENVLKLDKLQQTLDDAETKTNFEQMKTLMVATSNQLYGLKKSCASYFDNCDKENKNYAIEMSVCKTELKTATNRTHDTKFELKQELIEKLQKLNDEMTKERETLKLQATECKVVNEMLNEQLNVSTYEIKSEQTVHQVENGKNLLKITEQANTLKTLREQNENAVNELKQIIDELDQCKRDKIEFRDQFRESNAKLQVYEGIDITRLREEMRSAIDSLQSTTKP